LIHQVGHYRRWLPIVAAAKLSDNIPELEKMLIAQVERNLYIAPNPASSGQRIMPREAVGLFQK